MINIATVFDHRGRAKGKNDVGPIEVRVTIDRKPYYINTGIRVKRCQFKAGRIVNHDNCREVERMLGMIVGRVRDEITDCQERREAVDVAAIRRKVWEPKEDSSPLFVDWVEAEIENLGLKNGTYRHYKSLVNRLKEFGVFYKFDDLTVENVYKFDSWLRTLKKPQSITDVDAGREAQPLCVNTIHNYHKDLKAMIGRALRLGLIDKNPYMALRGEFKRVEYDTVEYLSRQDSLRFEQVQCPAGSQLEAAHDLFVFQLYTGMAYADTQVFDIGDYREVDGRWINTGLRVKTGVPYVSVLLDPAVEVLKKYNMRTPKMASQVYNRNLKQLGVMAGIAKPLHSHMARHTFATWMLAEGAKIENVSRMLGHTNIRQTQRYAKVLAQSVHDDFEMISKKLKAERI